MGSGDRRNGGKKMRNLARIIRTFIQHFPTFLMFRMCKDAKMTGEMLVYFCTVKTQGPVSLRGKKKLSIKLGNKTKTKLTVNSNYFYYHIVISQLVFTIMQLLYSKILLFSTKNVCLTVCLVLFLFFGFFPPLVIGFAPQ